MTLDDITRLLPSVFQQAAVPGSPLHALLATMAELHAATEQTLADLDVYFDPRRAPDAFVPMLAQWVDLDRLGDTGPASNGSATPTGDRLRRLVIAAADLSRRRGTSGGLTTFLSLAVGSAQFTVRENRGSDGTARPFHLWVEADAGLQPQLALIDRIVRAEKPAHLTHEITFAPPPAASGPGTH